MITLPPYHPKLNPTELVFRAILMKLRSMRSHYEEFKLNDVTREITNFLYHEISRDEVKSFYSQCGLF